MRSKLKTIGFTLVELIITIAIFGGFTLLLTVLIIGAMRNYSRGRVYQDTREQTSFLSRKISDDIRLAYPPPKLGTLSSNTLNIPSGVALPNPYGDVNSSVTGDIGTGIGDNRVVMFYPTVDADTFDINDPMKNNSALPAQLKFVEYVTVTESGIKRVRRNIYTIPKPGTGEQYGPYKKGTQNHWLITNNTIGTLERSDVIAELKDTNDDIWFQVKRPQGPKYPNAEQPGLYNTLYDRNLLEVSTRMTRYVKGDKGLPIAHEEKGQVQIRVQQ